MHGMPKRNLVENSMSTPLKASSERENGCDFLRNHGTVSSEALPQPPILLSKPCPRESLSGGGFYSGAAQDCTYGGI